MPCSMVAAARAAPPACGRVAANQRPGATPRSAASAGHGRRPRPAEARARCRHATGRQAIAEERPALRYGSNREENGGCCVVAVTHRLRWQQKNAHRCAPGRRDRKTVRATWNSGLWKGPRHAGGRQSPQARRSAIADRGHSVGGRIIRICMVQIHGPAAGRAVIRRRSLPV